MTIETIKTLADIAFTAGTSAYLLCQVFLNRVSNTRFSNLEEHVGSIYELLIADKKLENERLRAALRAMGHEPKA